MVNIGNDWDEVLKGEFEKEYYLHLREFLIDEYRNYHVYPNMHGSPAQKKPCYRGR